MGGYLSHHYSKNNIKMIPLRDKIKEHNENSLCETVEISLVENISIKESYKKYKNEKK